VIMTGEFGECAYDDIQDSSIASHGTSCFAV
jgi:hypothetical protein